MWSVLPIAGMISLAILAGASLAIVLLLHRATVIVTSEEPPEERPAGSVKPIKSDADYERALVRLDELMKADPESGCAESDELEVLAIVIDDYEQQRGWMKSKRHAKGSGDDLEAEPGPVARAV